MKIAHIVCMDRETQGIGKDGSMPWKQSIDLARFAYLTSNHVVIMGKKTFQSIGKPLGGRYNIVLSSSHIEGEHNYNMYSANSLSNALTIAKAYDRDIYRNDKIFIIGGQTLYEQTLPMTDIIYTTFLDTKLPENYFDTFYPDFQDYFSKIERADIRGKADAKNTYTYTFNVFKRD